MFSQSTRIASVARKPRESRGGGSRCRRACARRTARRASGSRSARARARSARATRCARQRIGLRLYAIADEPICSVSNGSSISPNDCSRRTSPLNFGGARRDARDDAEHLRVELARVGLPGDGDRRARSPSCAVTRASSSRTFAWSPPKSSRKLACVPVVPFTPRSGSVAMRWSRSARSSTRSCIQSVARLPTVVSCAGWRCV